MCVLCAYGEALKSEDLAAALGAAIVVTIFGCLGVVAAFGPKVLGAFFSEVLGEKGAAWVQAIGSVLAIFASAAFVWWQHRLDLHRAKVAELDATRRRMLLLADLAHQAHHIVSSTLKENKSKLTDMEADVAVSQMDQYRLALIALPKADLPNAVVLRAVVQVESHMAQSRRIINIMRHGLTPADLGLLRAFRSHLDEISAVLSSLADSEDFSPLASSSKHKIP